VQYARNVLEKAFGAQVASSLLERVTRSLKTKAFEFIRKADYKNLMTTIQHENPQTIALILSYARSDQASTIISELPKDIRIEVVERIAKMDRTSPEIVSQVEKVLERKVASMVSMDFTEVGGINYIADVMNKIDRSSEKYIFDELYKRDAKLADEIRKKMFIFEDILTLDGMSIQRFLRDVDSKDLVVALKGSNQEVQDIIFANMSQRMGETVRSDIEYLHNVRMRDVEEAQQRIVAVIRKLEEEGELIISKGGKDDMLV
jgi:flagellar motor switch protein FliG